MPGDDKVEQKIAVSEADLKKPWPGVQALNAAAPAQAKGAPLKKAKAKVAPSAKAVAKRAAKKVHTAKAAAKKTKNGKAKVAATGAAKKPVRTFPQKPLEECFNLANALREYNGGNAWSPKHLAEAIGMSAASSSFFYLTAASRDYGLTVGTRAAEKIELTPLGRDMVYPKTPQDGARTAMAAFRNVELFAKVYDYYQGGNLPEIQYLKNTLKTNWGVDEAYQDDFYELFQKNLAYLKTKGDLPAPPKSSSDRSNSANSSSIILGESSNSGKLIAFVAMPFSEKTDRYPKGYFDEVLKHLITPAAVKADFNARTAKKAGSEVIQSTIVNDLDSADLVIVDLTEHNPNVLFELGMRIAFNKPVCLIRAAGTAAIFDIDHMLRVYDYNPSMWPSTLEADIPALSEHIRKTWEGKDERSYLTMLRNSKAE